MPAICSYILLVNWPAWIGRRRTGNWRQPCWNAAAPEWRVRTRVSYREGCEDARTTGGKTATHDAFGRGARGRGSKPGRVLRACRRGGGAARPAEAERRRRVRDAFGFPPPMSVYGGVTLFRAGDVARLRCLSSPASFVSASERSEGRGPRSSVGQNCLWLAASNPGHRATWVPFPRATA
jgi:hypothetical protein